MYLSQRYLNTDYKDLQIFSCDTDYKDIQIRFSIIDVRIAIPFNHTRLQGSSNSFQKHRLQRYPKP